MQAIKGSARRVAGAVLALCLAAAPASAGIVLNASRYVYQQGASEIAVRVTNKGNLPVLTQAWIDAGDAQAAPETIDVPFNLTPPMARLEAGKSQTLRIAYTDGALPADRESQFWLNVLEVPPKPEDGGDTSKVQFAFRYRLKLFYRPKGLSGTADEAAEHLAWSRGADGSLVARNDSAYHVTLNELHVEAGGKTLELEPFSVAPHARVSPALPTPLGAGTVDVHYHSINDYGGFMPHHATVGAP